jgi:hypothetical protein
MMLRGRALKGALISWLLTHFPSEIRKIVPRKMVMVPSVTTMGGMFNFHTSRPLNMPKAVPKPTATTTVTTNGRSGAATFIIATAMPVSARLAATDRSMHLVRITII